LLGVAWPARDGWRNGLRGVDIPEDVARNFIALKDAHAKPAPKLALAVLPGREEETAQRFHAWTFAPKLTDGEKIARKAVSAAWLRLSRVSPDKRCPEVSHAIKLLEGALNGKLADWP
jgi:hypothetical protein